MKTVADRLAGFLEGEGRIALTCRGEDTQWLSVLCRKLASDRNGKALVVTTFQSVPRLRDLARRMDLLDPKEIASGHCLSEYFLTWKVNKCFTRDPSSPDIQRFLDWFLAQDNPTLSEWLMRGDTPFSALNLMRIEDFRADPLSVAQKPYWRNERRAAAARLLFASPKYVMQRMRLGLLDKRDVWVIDSTESFKSEIVSVRHGPLPVRLMRAMAAHIRRRGGQSKALAQAEKMLRDTERRAANEDSGPVVVSDDLLACFRVFFQEISEVMRQVEDKRCLTGWMEFHVFLMRCLVPKTMRCAPPLLITGKSPAFLLPDYMMSRRFLDKIDADKMIVREDGGECVRLEEFGTQDAVVDLRRPPDLSAAPAIFVWRGNAPPDVRALASAFPSVHVLEGEKLDVVSSKQKEGDKTMNGVFVLSRFPIPNHIEKAILYWEERGTLDMGCARHTAEAHKDWSYDIAMGRARSLLYRMLTSTRPSVVLITDKRFLENARFIEIFRKALPPSWRCAMRCARHVDDVSACTGTL